MKDSLTATRLLNAMNDAGITQRELANKSGVNEASISQYVNGNHAPSNVSAGKMAAVLGVHPLYLMGFAGFGDPSDDDNLYKETYDQKDHNNVTASTKHVASFSCGSGLIAPTLINGSVSGGTVSMNNPTPLDPVQENTNVSVEDSKLSPQEKTYSLEVLARLDVHQLQRIRNHINSLIDLKQ